MAQVYSPRSMANGTHSKGTPGNSCSFWQAHIHPVFLGVWTLLVHMQIRLGVWTFSFSFIILFLKNESTYAGPHCPCSVDDAQEQCECSNMVCAHRDVIPGCSVWSKISVAKCTRENEGTTMPHLPSHVTMTYEWNNMCGKTCPVFPWMVNSMGKLVTSYM